MGHVFFSPDFPRTVAAAQAGPAAMACFVALVCESSRLGNVDELPRWRARNVASTIGLGLGAIRTLERHGLIAATGEGWALLGKGTWWKHGPVRRDHDRSRPWRRHTPHVLARDDYACVYCGATEDLTLDHVIPRSRGGSHAPENLVTACRSCNSRKHARTPGEAGMERI